ncbi:30S ribosome-binding factor RbfA [Tistrella bauzanensis]|uniref:30S ribosome-binding factor RbfA n=1 Tax=Tistrella bauzanensis TaxID=657419 RepID=UPI0016694E53|nr:30S ribosome-binding factor RbfA [Tistrella bauzanensis]
MPKRAQGAAGPTQRQLRVGEQIRQVLAELLMRGETHDPELDGRPVTVSEVRMTPDLRTATAYVSPLGLDSDGAQVVIKALARSAAQLQRGIGRQVSLKFTPRLLFRLDTGFDYAAHIDRLLAKPVIRRDLDEDGLDEDGSDGEADAGDDDARDDDARRGEG